MAEQKTLSKAAILQHYTHSDNKQSEAAATVEVSIPTFIRERKRHGIPTKKRVPSNRLPFSDEEIVKRYFAEDKPTTRSTRVSSRPSMLISRRAAFARSDDSSQLLYPLAPPE